MAETHIYKDYTIIKVVRDEDLAEQIGKDIYFDLVDYHKVRSFRVQNQISFNIFKEKVAKEFGIPAQFQRFWIWEKRVNHTFRPCWPLTHMEEAQSVGQFINFQPPRGVLVELVLFLEVERGLDLCPIAPLNLGEDDILLFFKLYDPEKEELRYVGRLFVNCTDKPSEILTRLNELAGYDPDEEIELYQEIRFEPKVKCLPVEKRLTFEENELDNGDIICFQKASIDIKKHKHIRYPYVLSYLEYVHHRQVPFCASDIESEDEESLEEQNENIIDEETNVDKNTKFIIEDLEEIDCMIDEDDLEEIHEEIDYMTDMDVISAINLALSNRFTLPLKSQHPNLPEQLLQELRDIAFKEDLVEKFKQGLAPKVNFNAVKDKFEANADMFSSRELKQVRVVVNLLNNIEWMFEKLEQLEKERDSTKKRTDRDIETLEVTRMKVMMLKKYSPTFHHFQRKFIADLKAKHEKLQGDRDRIGEIEYKAKLEKLQGDRAKFAEIEDQEKDKITSFKKEVKPILHRLLDDQIKLKSVEGQILKAQTELESHEKLYRNFRAIPPF